MSAALQLAVQAYEQGEVPIGCVIVKDGVVIGKGRNECEYRHDATAHAEMLAIRQAEEYLNDWRLDGCQMYVTMEPCPMCAGAIINSRIPELVFGVRDEQRGAVGSVVDLFSERFGHKVRVFSGVMADDSRKLLKDFFEGIR